MLVKVFDQAGSRETAPIVKVLIVDRILAVGITSKVCKEARTTVV